MTNKNTLDNTEEKTTNEDLAKLIESVATALAGFQQEVKQDLLGVKHDVQGVKQDLLGVKQELQEEIQGLRSSVLELMEGAFTKDEKEQVLAMVRHYDTWLVADTKGTERITLTREEYNAAALAQRFPNRFDKPALGLVEVE